MSDTTFVYVTYIATTPEKLWEALTSGDFTKKYWMGHQHQSDWQEGSTVALLNESGNVTNQGKVVKSEPYRLLSYTWQGVKATRERASIVTFDLEAMGSTVKLTVKHEDLLPADVKSISIGWPMVLSGLKSLLETGRTLPLG